MPLHQVMNHPLHFRAFDVQAIVDIFSSGAIRRANSRLFPGEKFRIDSDAVLKTIDSHVGRFRESHGAQMAGNFQALTMRFVDGCFEFFRRQMYVRFERSHALGGAFVNRATCFVRTGDRMHLRKSERVRFQVWRSQKHVRPGALARVDGALDREVGLRKYASGRTQCGHARGEIHQRKRNRLLNDQNLLWRAIRRNGEEMFVKHHEAGKYSLAGKIDHTRTRRNLNRRRRADVGDHSIFQDQRLFVLRSATRCHRLRVHG